MPDTAHPASAIPAFGQADLSNCEREQIQFAGSIQEHGALLVVDEGSDKIIQASANAAGFLSLPENVLGLDLSQIPGNLADRVRPHRDAPLNTIPMAVRCEVGDPPAAYECLLHRPPDGGLILELERAGAPIDLSKDLGQALETILRLSSLRKVCDEAAGIFRALTGYDRVMVYRFDDEGHGEVFSEKRKSKLESFLGNRYPASDIPQIARRLYERNRIRLIGDVEYTPVPLEPRLSPITGQDLDMSLCFLRSMSPIHIQYLKNMGVRATLVASLIVGGRLWGLISCHHYEPRFLNYELRVACELLAETVSTRIAALESFTQAQSELEVRRLEQRMVEAISRDGDWQSALFDNPSRLLKPLGATGVALLFDDEILTTGEVPGTQQLREVGEWLDSRPRAPVIATASLGEDEPALAPLTPVASGLIAAPVSKSPGEYLIWFRPERVRTVTWGGNPFKSVVIGDDPSDLSPRRSFAEWHQLVEGTSDPWTPADRTAARLIGETVADVVLQFRTVRMLIVQDQLDAVGRSVRSSDHPVIITDPRGRILLTNEAFEGLLRAGHPHLQTLEDLPALFEEPAQFREQIGELLSNRRTWRGEVSLKAGPAGTKPLLLRADPVFSTPERVLGFVLLFSDLSARRSAEASRRRFQEEVVEHHRIKTVQLDSKADLIYRNLFSSIVGNAQLAALEITDGVDPESMPEMLESVQTSVTRTAELLEHLVRHSCRSADPDVET